MARINIDTKFYYEEDSSSEKIREDLIQLIRSSKMNLINDRILLSDLLRKRNDYFWLKGEANNSKIVEELKKMKKAGLIDWVENDVKSLDCLIKFTDKGKLIFFGWNVIWRETEKLINRI